MENQKKTTVIDFDNTPKNQVNLCRKAEYTVFRKNEKYDPKAAEETHRKLREAGLIP